MHANQSPITHSDMQYNQQVTNTRSDIPSLWVFLPPPPPPTHPFKDNFLTNSTRRRKKDCMKNLSVSIFSSTSSIPNDKSHHASSVRFHFDPYSAHVTITVPTELTFNLTFMCPNQGTVFVRIGSERSKALNWWKHEPFYFILPNKCKRSGSEIGKWRVFKDSDCTSGAKIVTVHLVPR